MRKRENKEKISRLQAGRTAFRGVFLLLFLASAGALLAGVSIGTVHFTLGETLRALLVPEESAARLLIWNLRLPRTLCGGMVGCCLALSGCILQGVMQNTLASPSTVGVTGGAAFVGYLTLVAFPAYAYLLPVGAILGAFLVTLLICALSWRRGYGPLRLILSGMAVSALLGAGNDVVRTFFAEALGNASGFLVGGLNGTNWVSVRLILPYAVLGLLACLLLPQKLNILMLGEETANSLGLRTGLIRLLLILLSSLLAGAAVAAAGMIGFVGLIVPHIARLLAGADYRRLFPASALLGFSMVIFCDTLGRILLPAGEIPVSIILSLFGAPFFLWLLYSRGTGER